MIRFRPTTRMILAVVTTLCSSPLPAQDARPASSPVVELRGGHWFTGRGFARGSRWMRDGRFIARPPTPADSVVKLDDQWLVPPFADAHTHSPDGVYGFDGIRDMYLTEGVFYVQVLANHQSGRLALAGKVNTPTSVDAAFADAAITSSGGHPQVLYESLALFRSTGGTPEQRQRAARSVSQEGDVYHRLDSLAQVPALVARLRRDSVPVLKIMVLDADNFAALATDTSAVGQRGLPPEVLKPLIDSAHAMGRRVWAHIETARDFELALDAGVDGFAHAPGYGVAFDADSTLDRYRLSAAVAARAGARRVFVIPTLGLSWELTRRDSAARRRTQEITATNVRLLQRAGARLLTGSDTYSSVDAIRNDVAALGDALHSTPLELLRLRAIDTPLAIFPTRAIGALSPSHEASVLALRCNPLEDVRCQEQITLRLKQGEWLSVGPKPSAPTQSR